MRGRSLQVKKVHSVCAFGEEMMQLERPVRIVQFLLQGSEVVILAVGLQSSLGLTQDRCQSKFCRPCSTVQQLSVHLLFMFLTIKHWPSGPQAG